MELEHVVDEDGNELVLTASDGDVNLLLVTVTDENEIPIGMFLDVDSAVAVRNALDAFIRNAS